MDNEENIQTVAQWLSTSRHTIAFTGAGISTPSGIPDFRSPESGLWAHADPMTVASIFGFRQNPQGFYDWVRPLAQCTLEAQPNPAHLALAELEAHGKLKSIITQNIDMLHSKAGNQTVYELHGHLRDSTCIQCFRVYEAEDSLQQFLIDGSVPKCVACGGVLKPNVILFGEQLPYQALQGAKNESKQCDLMMIIGSSLEVAPASDLPMLAQRHGAKVIIVNLESTFFDRYADKVIYGDAADILPRIVQRLSELIT